MTERLNNSYSESSLYDNHVCGDLQCTIFTPPSDSHLTGGAREAQTGYLGRGHVASAAHWFESRGEYACSVLSDFLRPHGRQPTRLPCPWNFPGKNPEIWVQILTKS